jgi:hypothetical protein
MHGRLRNAYRVLEGNQKRRDHSTHVYAASQIIQYEACAHARAHTHTYVCVRIIVLQWPQFSGYIPNAQ